jgi:hypothetical protein
LKKWWKKSGNASPKLAKMLKPGCRKVQNEIAEIDREFEAIKAYEVVKAGKAQKGAAASKEPGQRARRGERQQEVLDLIGQHPDGLTRSEILERLGVKGDKKAEASISNALNNLKKTGRLGSEGKDIYWPE